MIFTSTHFNEAIKHELSLGVHTVWASSFGINAGVSGKGKIYEPSPTHQIIDSINRHCRTARFLIGLPTHSTNSYLERVVCCGEVWRHIKFRTSLDLHLKCWIFFRKRKVTALMGGRNMGDSTWSDASLWLPPAETKELVGFFEGCWNKAQAVKISPALVIRTNGKVIT